MNAHNNVQKLFNEPWDTRLALTAVQLRFGAGLDFLVARWLERCATNVEAAQRMFRTTDDYPARELGMGASLVVSFPRWDESQ